MDRSSSGLEDQRALQLAFELSMLGFDSSPTTTEPTSGETLTPVFPDDSRGKKSQNMTECVPVPSSEHVAEIVGRQGKDLRLLGSSGHPSRDVKWRWEHIGSSGHPSRDVKWRLSRELWTPKRCQDVKWWEHLGSSGHPRDVKMSNGGNI
uniref:Uncharacterized protein n=1 Tax=Timema poppense TaxID=170557 RepID=A0A7R9CFE2_TIMPO|nr:unnamed protein product [Timema poppensis]